MSEQPILKQLEEMVQLLKPPSNWPTVIVTTHDLWRKLKEKIDPYPMCNGYNPFGQMEVQLANNEEEAQDMARAVALEAGRVVWLVL